MTSAEMVTDFKLMDAENKMVSVKALIKALNDFCGKMAEEYKFCDNTAWDADGLNKVIPDKYWNLVAYAVEGKNEGYYVHVGAIIHMNRQQPSYMDFGFAKTWSPESAYALATAASRFLAAAQWN